MRRTVGRGLKAGEFRQTGNTIDGLGLLPAQIADDESAGPRLQGSDSGELLVSKHGKAIQAGALERIDFQIKIESDVFVLFDVRLDFERETEILILHLRDDLTCL